MSPMGLQQNTKGLSQSTDAEIGRKSCSLKGPEYKTFEEVLLIHKMAANIRSSVNNIFDKGSVFQIYKELSKLNLKKQPSFSKKAKHKTIAKTAQDTIIIK